MIGLDVTTRDYEALKRVINNFQPTRRMEDQKVIEELWFTLLVLADLLDENGDDRCNGLRVLVSEKRRTGFISGLGTHRDCIWWSVPPEGDDESHFYCLCGSVERFNALSSIDTRAGEHMKNYESLLDAYLDLAQVINRVG
jgi:hypothetical protein